MQKVITRVGTLLLILLQLCFSSACRPSIVIPPPPTASPQTPLPPTATQPVSCILRFEFSATSDYANFEIYNPEYVLSFDFVSISGDPASYDFTGNGMALNQEIESAEDGESVGITVDYEFDAVACAGTLDFKLQSGALNGSSARIYRFVDGEYQLIREVEYRRSASLDGAMFLEFTLDLGGVAQALPENPTPMSDIPPSEAATIIFYNGIVLTIDENFTQAQALAVQGDKILSVGSDSEVLAYQGTSTIMINLHGKTLMPGFIDGHSHILINAGTLDQTIEDNQELALSWGITSLSEMRGESEFIQDLMDLEAEGRLRVRVSVFATYNYGVYDPVTHGVFIAGDGWYPEHDPIIGKNLMLQIPGLKIFVDGSGNAGRGCPAMSEPYDPISQSQDWFQVCLSEYGDLYWDPAELNRTVAELQDAGYRVAFHAMGDRAIEVTLDAIEFALDGRPNDLYRHQIQHSSTVRDDQIQRYIDLDVLSSVRGYFNTCDQDDYRNDAASNRYAFPGLGVHAYLETDNGWRAELSAGDAIPQKFGNPLMHLYGIVTHEQLAQDGSICTPDPWIANKIVTVEEALRWMTIEGAYAVSREDVLGSLEPGKFADIIILSNNPLAVEPRQLKDLEVWMTMVGGETEYCKPGQEAYCP
jgi:predicted amidohydrolase YtcJ